eukprot:675414_1
MAYIQVQTMDEEFGPGTEPPDETQQESIEVINTNHCICPDWVVVLVVLAILGGVVAWGIVTVIRSNEFNALATNEQCLITSFKKSGSGCNGGSYNFDYTATSMEKCDNKTLYEFDAMNACGRPDDHLMIGEG